MVKQKNFLTFTQQVTSLNNKNIIIPNNQYAEEMPVLMVIVYSLIKPLIKFWTPRFTQN